MMLYRTMLSLLSLLSLLFASLLVCANSRKLLWYDDRSNPPNAQIKWDNGCSWDSAGRTITWVPVTADKCGKACYDNPKCTHFSHLPSFGCALLQYTYQPSRRTDAVVSQVVCGFIQGRSYVRLEISDSKVQLSGSCKPSDMIDKIVCKKDNGSCDNTLTTCEGANLEQSSSAQNRNQLRAMRAIIQKAYKKALKEEKRCKTVCPFSMSYAASLHCTTHCWTVNVVPTKIIARLVEVGINHNVAQEVSMTLSKAEGKSGGFCKSDQFDTVKNVISLGSELTGIATAFNIVLTTVDLACNFKI